jgi:hypothetical protein
MELNNRRLAGVPESLKIELKVRKSAQPYIRSTQTPNVDSTIYDIMIGKYERRSLYLKTDHTW